MTSLPFDRVATFVRLLTHDFRNALNSFDLEASLLQELVEDEEARAELKKMRLSVVEQAARLQQLTARFAPINPQPITVPLSLLMEDLRTRVEKRFAQAAELVSWPSAELSGELEADYELLCAALMEVFDNAFKFHADGQPITVEVSSSVGFTFKLIEGKPELASDPSGWGEPFVSTRRGGYGLGLFHAHRIATALGGTLTTTHRDRLLTTTISFG